MEQVLRYLPQLLHDRPESDALEQIGAELAPLVQARSMYIRWPAVGDAVLSLPIKLASASESVVIDGISTPLSEPEIRLQPTGIQALAPIPVAGREPGLLVVMLPLGAELSRNYLALFGTIGSLIGASPVFGRRIGSMIDQARLLQRLQDASVICGRMAHDFDNILTGILGFTDLTLPMLAAGSQQFHFLTEVSKAGQRGITFTQQLHQLSRSGGIKPQPASVASVMAREEARVRALVKADQLLNFRLPSDLPPVAIDAGPLQIVLSHLLDNAIEAIPSAGAVTVRASVVELDVPMAEGFLGRVKPGKVVEILISDQGPGIKPEHRNRLFAEPFFTTKVRHRGLGLAIVYRFLHGHQGGVRIEPLEPRGTLARLVLPLAPQRLSGSGLL